MNDLDHINQAIETAHHEQTARRRRAVRAFQLALIYLCVIGLVVVAGSSTV